MRFFTAFFLIIFHAGVSQPFDANFSLPTDACIDERIQLINNSSDVNTYQWDFCLGDFLSTPDVETGLASGFGLGTGMEVIKDGDDYFGFVLNSSTLYRLEFGDMLTNTPNVVNMGNLGVLDNSEELVITMEGNQWVGFTGFGAARNGGNIVKLIWDDPRTTPFAVNLGNFGTNGRIRGLDVINSSGQKILVLAIGNRLTRVDFRDSFLNSVDNDNVVTSASFTDISNPLGLSIVKKGDEWVAIVASFNNRGLSSFNLGADPISTEPALVNTTFFTTFGGLVKLEVIQEGNAYFGVLSINGGSMRVINFKGLEASDIVEEIPVSGLPATYGLEVVKLESRHLVFGSRGGLDRMIFEADCAVSIEFSDDSNPLVSYLAADDFVVSLLISNANGDTDHAADTITITPNTAPTLTLTSQNNCLTSPIQFTSESDGSGLAYNWDFGDGGNSTDANPSHVFAAAGEYEVTLSIDDGTCGNFTRQTITIFEEPVPEFTLPTGIICTNQHVVFINDTPGDFGGFITYQWQVDGVIQSAERDFIFEFPSGGDKEIKLVASIPGCTVEIAKNLLDVREGTLPDFTFNDSCLGELVTFTNQSIGDITSIEWDFGNSINSTLESPSVLYTESGTFDVQLTLTNTDGCITSLIRPITILALPQVDFESELACENLATQFTDLTTLVSDNISIWEWDFGDGTPLSDEQNPEHIYSSSGIYEVKLKTTTTSGCLDSLTKEIMVLSSPTAEFSTDRICVGVPISFSDQSEPVGGESITSWAWDLAGQFSDQQNPEITFDVPLDYQVSLSVTSENLCTATETKVLTISPPAEVGFEVEDNCENEVTILRDTTLINGDVIIGYSWTLNEGVIGSDQELLFPNTNADSYETMLEVSTEKGCIYQATQSFVINEAPLASFTSSRTFGSPPLEVEFLNSSEGASSYQWAFGDGNTSSSFEPTNIFQERGEFNTELVVINDFGCTDSVFQRISVLDPEYNLILKSINLVEDGLLSGISLVIENSGTIALDSFYVNLVLGGELLVNQKVVRRILPNETITELLEFNFSNRRLEFLCITLEGLMNIEEESVDDNEQCFFFDNAATIISPPVPNPTNGIVAFSIVTESDTPVDILLFDSQGVEVSDLDLTTSIGRNTITLDLSSLKQGLYFVALKAGGFQEYYRIMLNN